MLTKTKPKGTEIVIGCEKYLDGAYQEILQFVGTNRSQVDR